MSDFITADKLARLTATIVGHDLGLGALMTRDFDADFGSGSGATIRVRVPGAVKAEAKGIFDKTTPLTVHDLTEQSYPVALTEHAYSSIVLAEGDTDLAIEDFTSQVLIPQATSIVKRIESQAASTLMGVPETAIAFDESTPARTFTKIRAQLRTNGLGADVPLHAVVGSNVYGALLDADGVSTAGTTFGPDGKVRGFDVVESTRIDADAIVAFTTAAFALVVRAPQVPTGAPFGASVTEGGFSLRYLRSYDATVAAERSIVSAFTGVSELPLAVDNEDGTISLVEHGGAVHIDTSASA